MPVFDEAVEPTSTLAQKLAVANANGNATSSYPTPDSPMITHFPFLVRRYGEDPHDSSGEGDALCPQKKKYAKEAWPGRKPMLGQL